MAATKKTLLWKIEYFIFLAIETFFRIIPVSLCYRIGSLLGSLSYYFVKKRRLAVIRNLTIAYANQLDQNEVISLSKQIFACNGGNLIASIKTATMSLASIEKCVIIEGGDAIERFAQENNGAIIILPHMGNWEIGVRISAITYAGIESGAMYRPLNNPYLDALVKKRRQHSKSKLFSRNDGMIAPLQLIRQGGALGILADQRVKKGGVITPFFGRLTPFAPLPEIYKKRTKCGILSLSIQTLSPGKWKLIYTEEATKDETFTTAMVASSIERLMRLSPQDCFWMQDRWRLNKKPLLLIGKQPIQYASEQSGIEHKYHLAIYLETVSSSHISALTRLAVHRTDIHLLILSPSACSELIPNSTFHNCPSLSSESAFLSFFEQLNESAYIDILFHPQRGLELPASMHSHPCYINPESLEQSLIEAGLPEQPYK